MLPDYLHSAEADHFAFIRVPKILLQNEAFHGISVEAKLLYSLLFDRTELSNKNGWRDDQDRVYIIFTVAEIQENMNCGNKKAIQLLDELESKYNHELSFRIDPLLHFEEFKLVDPDTGTELK